MSELKKLVKELGLARETMAYLQSLTGAKKPSKEEIDDVIKVYFDIDTKIMQMSIGNVADELSDMINERKNWLELKDIMSSQSSTETGEIIKNIDRLNGEIQTAKCYDPESYFNTYFFNNINGITNYTIETAKNVRGFYNNNENFEEFMNGAFYPDILYHGTKEQFVQFDFGTFPGMYFAKNQDYAQYFSGTDGAMFKVYLNVKNPMDLLLFGTDKVDYDEFVAYVELKYGYRLAESKMLRALSKSQKGLWAWQYLRMSPDWLRQISESRIFDSILFIENNPDQKKNGKDNETEAIMVFRPENIKLATGNLTMSPYSKDVRFALGGSIADEKFQKQLRREQKQKLELSELAINVVGPNVYNSMDEDDKKALINSLSLNYDFEQDTMLEDGGKLNEQ